MGQAKVDKVEIENNKKKAVALWKVFAALGKYQQDSN